MLPGKKTLAPPLMRRGTVGTVGTAEMPATVTLKSPDGHVPAYSYVRGSGEFHFRQTQGNILFVFLKYIIRFECLGNILSSRVQYQY